MLFMGVRDSYDLQRVLVNEPPRTFRAEFDPGHLVSIEQAGVAPSHPQQVQARRLMNARSCVPVRLAADGTVRRSTR